MSSKVHHPPSPSKVLAKLKNKESGAFRQTIGGCAIIDELPYYPCLGRALTVCNFC